MNRVLKLFRPNNKFSDVATLAYKVSMFEGTLRAALDRYGEKISSYHTSEHIQATQTFKQRQDKERKVKA